MLSEDVAERLRPLWALFHSDRLAVLPTVGSSLATSRACTFPSQPPFAAETARFPAETRAFDQEPF